MNRIIASLRLVTLIVTEVLKSNIQVIGWILARNVAPPSREIAVPVKLTSPLGRMFFANIITLTPGTLSLWFDERTATLTIHALDGADEQGILKLLKERIEPAVAAVFEPEVRRP